MIALDVGGATCPLFFLLAIQHQSISVIHAVTFLQQLVSGLCEPCDSAVVPQMVPDKVHVKKVTAMAGLALEHFCCGWELFGRDGIDMF